MKHIAVIGASLAGLSAAQALRSQGFAGALTVVGAESHRPYDRPPLSKGFLAGTTALADLALERDGEELDADWRFGVRAQRLDVNGARVELSDGSALDVDGVVLATGASARTLSGTGPLAGVHTLRTLDDAVALRTELLPGVRLVVIGAGFIGAEVASTASQLGIETTVVEVAPSPLAGPLGVAMGSALARLHAQNGVALHCGVAVSALSGTDRVIGVELADGRHLPADVVVVGVGALPNVDWLAGSGLDVTNGVRCDEAGVTSIPGVVAVGDCSAWRNPRTGGYLRLEHWTSARERPATAVAALLNGSHRPPAKERAPYFWSDQYGSRIQFAGHAQAGDQVNIEVGDADAGSFLAVYRRDGEIVAVLGVDQVREFTRWRRLIT